MVGLMLTLEQLEVLQAKVAVAGSQENVPMAQAEARLIVNVKLTPGTESGSAWQFCSSQMLICPGLFMGEVV